MRIACYERDGERRLGGVTPDGLVDLTDARSAFLRAQGVSQPDRRALEEVPPDMIALLRLERGLVAAQEALDHAVKEAGTLTPLERVNLLAPVPRPGKVFGIGLNYRGHAEESGAKIPAQPILFAMWPTTVTGPGRTVRLVPESQKIDFEAELGVLIGRAGRDIPVDRALDHVAGYTIVNDVSARDVQLGEGGQWVRGKAFDDFAPCGPWLVTTDEIPDPQALDIGLSLNGTVMQESNTGDMIFSVAELVSFLSRGVTLEPGDLIATGTPPGVGVFRNPPRFLQPGDSVTVRIAGIGELTNDFE